MITHCGPCALRIRDILALICNKITNNIFSNRFRADLSTAKLIDLGDVFEPNGMHPNQTHNYPSQISQSNQGDTAPPKRDNERPCLAGRCPSKGHLLRSLKKNLPVRAALGWTLVHSTDTFVLACFDHLSCRTWIYISPNRCTVTVADLAKKSSGGTATQKNTFARPGLVQSYETTSELIHNI